MRHPQHFALAAANLGALACDVVVRLASLIGKDRGMYHSPALPG